MNYYVVEFHLDPVLPAREVLVAELAERGFESFTESDEGLSAYIQEDQYSADLLNDLMTAAIPEQKMTFESKLIADQNWNAEWEKNFNPIDVEGKCLVRAPFHPSDPGFEHEIIIEPKMSFGTGHHATTYLIIAQMMRMDFKDKLVLDMGCGTGVLAILAAKLGASGGEAIDIDEWAFENTVENMERNGVRNFNVIQGGAEAIPEERKYDIVLANINRNILTRDMGFYVRAMKSGGTILFSGFYLSDKPEIDNAASENGLVFQGHEVKDDWCMLRYTLS